MTRWRQFSLPIASRTGSAHRAPRGAGGNCTSRRQHAHVTESRVVLYRWHPWYQQTVYVSGRSARGEQAVVRCALEQADVARALEVPQWMFDALTCARTSLAVSPSVDVAALREAAILLRAAVRPEGRPVLQAEHKCKPGGAYATHDEITAEGSADVVSSAADESDLGEFAGGSSEPSAPASGPISATPRRSRRSGEGGGA